MRNITCCFTGHRIISDKIAEELKAEVYNTCEQLIARGITRFVCGGAIGFDILSSMCVLALKKKYNNIKLVLIIPCSDQDLKWNKQQKMIYRYVLENADEVRILHERYIPGCMQERNKLMVNESSVCIAHLERSFGGTKSTVDYALDNDLEVIYI